MMRWASTEENPTPTIRDQVEVHDALHKEEQIITWKRVQSTFPHETIAQGQLDYVWMSTDLINRKCLLAAAVAAEPIASSDHFPVMVHIDFVRALGTELDTFNEFIIRAKRRVLKYVNKKQREAYSEALEIEWEKRNLDERIRILLQTAKTTGTAEQSEMDMVMESITEALLSAEDSIDTSPEDKKFKYGWSEQFTKNLKARVILASD